MLDPGGGGAPKRKKTPSYSSVRATLGGADVAAASAAARAARRGSNPARAASSALASYGPSGTSATSTASRVATRATRQARQERRQIRTARRTIQKAIRSDPPKAANLVRRELKTELEPVPAPRVELSNKTRPKQAKRPTIEVSKTDARKFFSPAPKVRQRTAKKLTQTAVQAHAPKPQAITRAARRAIIASNQPASPKKIDKITDAAARGLIKTDKVVALAKLAKRPEVGEREREPVAKKPKKAKRTTSGAVQQAAAQTGSPIGKRLAKLAVKFGGRENVPPSLLMGLMEVESGFGTAAGTFTGSSAGAQGVTQFMPGTAETYGVDVSNTRKGIKSQVKGAAKLLADTDVQNDPTYALAAYNAGPGNVQAGMGYAADVQERAKKFAPLDTEPAVPAPKKRKTVPVKGEIIGTPYQGTHTLGNWQSDNAVDIAVPEGTKIRAAKSGVVDKVSGNNADPSSQFNGFAVTIGGDTFYTHLSEASVQPGDKVKAGQVIGLSGSANGVPHLHFGVAPELDPQAMIGKAATSGAPAAQAPPAKEVKKWIKLTEAPAEVAAEQGVKESKAYKSSVRNMAPELQAALVQLGKRTGTPVQINEGYRTTKRANEFPSGTASNHHAGLAADVDNNSAYSSADLAAVGLTNTAVSGEPWHFELSDASGVGTSPTISGGYSSTVPTTGTTTSATTPSPSLVTPQAKAKTQKKRKGRKLEGREKQRLLRELIAQGPIQTTELNFTPSQTPYADYARTREVEVGL